MVIITCYIDKVFPASTSSLLMAYMTNHTGPQHWECHPGTKFWHPPVEVTQFRHRGVVLPPISVFERPNKNKFISMKQNCNLNHFQQLLFYNFPRLLINIIFLALQKTGIKTAPRVPKLQVYLDGRVPKFSSWVTPATLGDDLVCHMTSSASSIKNMLA